MPDGVNPIPFATRLAANLARLYGNANTAQAFLAMIEYPLHRQPPFQIANVFWNQVIQEIRNGILPLSSDEGVERLIAVAISEYLGSSELRLLAEEHRRNRPPSQPPEPTPSAAEEKPREARASPARSSEPIPEPPVRAGVGASLLVQGDVNPGVIRRRVQVLTGGPVYPTVEQDGFLALTLPEATAEQACDIRESLAREFPSARVTVLGDHNQERILDRLFVSGPDLGRFELNDVPGATRVSEVARAIIAESYAGSWPRDRNNVERSATVDLEDADGRHHRLPPEASLDQCGVQNGDTLHVAPESTAGGVSPLLREAALRKARIQILAFAATCPGFEVLAPPGPTPSEYLFRFSIPSYAPPSEANGRPRRIDDHEVLAQLSATFPMEAPALYWRTPIYHPNIEAKIGWVCLGMLADRYQPNFDFGDLCRMLVEIAGFRNYSVVEEGFYNQEAALWTMSEEGQEMIAAIGGRLYFKREEITTPPPILKIRRLDG